MVEWLTREKRKEKKIHAYVLNIHSDVVYVTNSIDRHVKQSWPSGKAPGSYSSVMDWYVTVFLSSFFLLLIRIDLGAWKRSCFPPHAFSLMVVPMMMAVA